MSNIASAVLAAAAAAAARPDVPLAAGDVAPVAAAITEAMPAPAGLETLWPQLVRYAIAMAGTALAARGLGEAADWQALSGAVIAVAPVVWRIAATLLARRAV
ncbi:hypothetical protein [Azorhizobium doebereinerae]|uniref:Pam3-gp28 family putative phage holin n=1 Tax=Azorhizobium doebereinerae TaxID=281091 RepID=UPI00041A654E|nr:hypothetical protein [Azorhizobium doebereinerae]